MNEIESLIKSAASRGLIDSRRLFSDAAQTEITVGDVSFKSMAEHPLPAMEKSLGEIAFSRFCAEIEIPGTEETLNAEFYAVYFPRREAREAQEILSAAGVDLWDYDARSRAPDAIREVAERLENMVDNDTYFDYTRAEIREDICLA